MDAIRRQVGVTYDDFAHLLYDRSVLRAAAAHQGAGAGLKRVTLHGVK